MIKYNKPLDMADSALRFIQLNFNTSDTSYEDLLDNLLEGQKVLERIKQSRELNNIERQALKSANELVKTGETLNTPLKADYGLFNDLSDEISSILGDKIQGNKIPTTLGVADKIVDDIVNTRDWLNKYNKLQKVINNKLSSNRVDQSLIYELLREDLLNLGRSVLGRAIELTPKDTGNLRRSAVLIDLGNAIEIAYTADYATYVHENMEIHHPNHLNNPDCGGQAKFLEVALQEFFPDRRVWVEVHGYSGVSVRIGINPNYLTMLTSLSGVVNPLPSDILQDINRYILEYRHYN